MPLGGSGPVAARYQDSFAIGDGQMAIIRLDGTF
jgi:hypothetical protein